MSLLTKLMLAAMIVVVVGSIVWVFWIAHEMGIAWEDLF